MRVFMVSLFIGWLFKVSDKLANLFGRLENADGAIAQAGGDLQAVRRPHQALGIEILTGLLWMDEYIFDHKLMQ